MSSQMTRIRRIAFWITLIALSVVVAFLARLAYLRDHCQQTYGSNPWTGGAHGGTPWWCRTPTEDARIRANEKEAKRNGTQAFE